MAIIDRIQQIQRRYREIEQEFSNPETASDPKRLAALGKEMSKLEPVIQRVHKMDKLRVEIRELEEMLTADKEMSGLARTEITDKQNDLAKLEKQLLNELIPKDPYDAKNVILEIRAGTGGEEAALFAAELYRMYSRYSERRGWKTELLSVSNTGIGGMKEVILSISGSNVFSVLKHESGVHRIQRIPVTESSGRIHTSAASVAVLPEAEEVDVQIREEDLRIDVYRSSGHGGQSVNTTDSAVRITHVPTGLVVTCQDEKSQLKNRTKALKVLRTRLYDAQRQKVESERAAARKQQVGSGDRSERIRTYNFPQNRVTDHRVNVTLHSLNDILDGDINELIQPLIEAETARKLEDESSGVGMG